MPAQCSENEKCLARGRVSGVTCTAHAEYLKRTSSCRSDQGWSQGRSAPRVQVRQSIPICAFRCVLYLEFNEERCARTPPSQCSRVGARLSRCRQPLAREDPHSVVMGKGQDMIARYSPVVIKRCRWAQPSCRFLTWHVLCPWELAFSSGRHTVVTHCRPRASPLGTAR